VPIPGVRGQRSSNGSIGPTANENGIDALCESSRAHRRCVRETFDRHLWWAPDVHPIIEGRLDGNHVALRAQALGQSAPACVDLARKDRWPVGPSCSIPPGHLSGLSALADRMFLGRKYLGQSLCDL
jgi:hypothetical protein